MAREYDHLFKLLIIGDSGMYGSTIVVCTSLTLGQLLPVEKLPVVNIVTVSHAVTESESVTQ